MTTDTPQKTPMKGVALTLADIRKALQPMILSASGWRKIFAIEEESSAPEITPADQILSAAMAEVYSSFLQQKTGKKSPLVVIGRDARFTGPMMADAMVRLLLHRGIRIEYHSIIAAPEIMAYTACNSDADGFIYISASHNPIGHNGVKFGLSSGGVLGKTDIIPLIEAFKSALDSEDKISLMAAILRNSEDARVNKIFKESAVHKERALHTYEAFTRELITGETDTEAQEVYFDQLREALMTRPLGVVGELNGSARGCSIDQDFLDSLGIRTAYYNHVPGEIVHRIIPEGRSLDLCRSYLENQEDKAFEIGYVPDCDGDRGNLVYRDFTSGKATILEAQEVFALSVLSELTDLAGKGTDMSKVAVAVNGPTSMRIDAIASRFGARVFRAEVGEANVVTLASRLREQGYLVRILGEGSNGGNITHPAAVRDPLNTLTALIKLLRIRGNGKQPGLFEIWCEKSGIDYQPDFTLKDIIDTLPSFITTSAFEPQAIMQVKSSHTVLKARYEDLFPKAWKKVEKDWLERFEIARWKESNTEGTEEKWGVGREFRSGEEKGGMKILFSDPSGKPVAYLWMRGSGTEPVFRVLVDSRGTDPEMEKVLLNWHRTLINQADLD